MLSNLVGYACTSGGMTAESVTTYEFRGIVNTSIAAFVLIPISLLRDISSLAFSSMLSLLALTYTGILMIIELPWYNKYYREQPEYFAKPFILDYNFASACAMSFFAFTCQV